MIFKCFGLSSDTYFSIFLQPQQVESALCEHYAVSEARHLGHGNITRLCSAAEKRGKHTASVYNTLFECALLGKSWYV